MVLGANVKNTMDNKKETEVIEEARQTKSFN